MLPTMPTVQRAVRIAGAVFELQRNAVIRPTLQADVVSAGGDGHAISLAFALAAPLFTAMVRA